MATAVPYLDTTPIVRFLARVTGAIASDIETYPKVACLLTSGPLLTRSLTNDKKVRVAPFQYLDASLNVQSYPGGDIALPTTVIPQNKWAAYTVKLTLSTGVVTIVGAADNATGYNSEALAEAAYAAAGGGAILVAHFTLNSQASATFTGGTDGLFGGTSGNVALATNYYGIPVTPNTIIVTFPAAEEAKRKVDFIRKELDRLYGARYQSIQIRFTGDYVNLVP